MTPPGPSPATNFDRLHPALRHHVVNSLGWRDLRPFQDAVIPHALAGEHLVVLAPTAGGKTEAALFPVLSRMLSEDWRGLVEGRDEPVGGANHDVRRYQESDPAVLEAAFR